MFGHLSDQFRDFIPPVLASCRIQGRDIPLRLLRITLYTNVNGFLFPQWRLGTRSYASGKLTVMAAWNQRYNETLEVGMVNKETSISSTPIQGTRTVNIQVAFNEASLFQCPTLADCRGQGRG